jgi:hypothetical protein
MLIAGNELGFWNTMLDDEDRRDDHHDRDRLAQRPAQAQHGAADHGALAEREHDGPDHPQRVAPRAYAPSRSPSGAWLNASRMIEVAIGRTISATTVPAMKVEEV